MNSENENSDFSDLYTVLSDNGNYSNHLKDLRGFNNAIFHNYHNILTPTDQILFNSFRKSVRKYGIEIQTQPFPKGVVLACKNYDSYRDCEILVYRSPVRSFSSWREMIDKDERPLQVFKGEGGEFVDNSLNYETQYQYDFIIKGDEKRNMVESFREFVGKKIEKYRYIHIHSVSGALPDIQTVIEKAKETEELMVIMGRTAAGGKGTIAALHEFNEALNQKPKEEKLNKKERPPLPGREKELIECRERYEKKMFQIEKEYENEYLGSRGYEMQKEESYRTYKKEEDAIMRKYERLGK